MHLYDDAASAKLTLAEVVAGALVDCELKGDAAAATVIAGAQTRRRMRHIGKALEVRRAFDDAYVNSASLRFASARPLRRAVRVGKCGSQAPRAFL